jgi:hypothetical protein
MNRRDREEAADLISGVLELAGQGNLSADGPAAVALIRRLEGADIALRSLDRPRAALGKLTDPSHGGV